METGGNVPGSLSRNALRSTGIPSHHELSDETYMSKSSSSPCDNLEERMLTDLTRMHLRENTKQYVKNFGGEMFKLFRTCFVTLTALLLVIPAVSNSAEGLNALNEVDVDLMSDQTGQRGDINGGCRWLDYYCNMYYYCPIPSDEDGDFFNMRFTVETPCTLKTIEMTFYNAYEEFSDVSGQGVDMYVWNDDGSGFPGDVLYTVNVPSANMAYYPENVSIDVESIGMVFEGDFHIGYTTVDQVNDNYAILADDGTCGDLRSSHYYAGIWETMIDHIAADVNFFMAAEICGPSQFIAHFSTPERESYPFDVTISDGANIIEFDDVDFVSTTVSPVFTLALEYEVDSHFVMMDWELTIAPGEISEFEFYALDPNTVVGRTTPYLFGKEVGTTVDLQWDYSEIDTILTYTVQTTPLERYAFVGTWIQPSTDRANVGWVALDSIDIWRCPNGQDTETYYYPDTVVVEHTTWLVPSIYIPPDDDDSSITVSHEFSAIPENIVPVGIRKATDDHVRVPGYDVTLHTAGGQSIDPEYFYPQWALEPGSVYSLKVQSLSPEHASMTYPLLVPDTSTTNALVFDPMLPETDILEPFIVIVAGKNVFANCSYSGFEHAPGDSIAVNVTTDMQCDWWGSFVLPEGMTVDELVAYTNERGVIHLTYLDYWIEYSAAGYNIITIRIEPSFTRLNLRYTEQACEPGDANDNGAIDIDDVVYLISYIFSGGLAPTPYPVASGDATCDCTVDIDDIVYLIAYIFSGGPPPCSWAEWGSSCGGPLGCGDDGGYDTYRSEAAVSGKFVDGKANLNIAENNDGMRETVSLSIDANVEVQAVQFDFKITGDVSNLSATSLIDGIQVFSGEADGMFRVGLFDLHGLTMIPASASEIASVTYDGDDRIELVNSVAIARGGGKLTTTVNKGSADVVVPRGFSLSQNFPNPFNPTTQINFTLPAASLVRLDVYNTVGQKVSTLANEHMAAGTHTVTWNGRTSNGEPAASGVYFYRITAGDFNESRKMLLMK
jgi:hypothetical protein